VPLPGYYSEALPTLARLKRAVLRLSRMHQSEPWGVIAVPMEAHSKQRGLPPRMYEPD